MERTPETITERATTKPLYTPAELGRMTDDALDELLSYYSDKGEHDHAEQVQREIDERYNALMDDREAEMEHEAEQERQQQMHDEMIASMPMPWEV